MKTTVIGSYPKPEYLKINDWFKTSTTGCYSKTVTKYLKNENLDDLEEKFDRAADEVINELVHLGIDIITDGEIRRENYIHTFCRSIINIDFNILTE